MTSSYPAGLDSFDEPSAPTTTALGSAGDTSPARKHSEHHRDLGDAIEAVQGELGLDPAGSFATVKARLDGMLLHDRNDRTSGNLTLNSTTWANVDTGLDITLSAATGDWIEVGISATWGSEAVAGFLDVVSVVSGSPVNSWGKDAAPDNAHPGVCAWIGNGSRAEQPGGSIIRQLVAGDISGGQVTLRLRYRTGAAVNKTLYANSTADMIIFWARNHRT